MKRHCLKRYMSLILTFNLLILNIIGCGKNTSKTVYDPNNDFLKDSQVSNFLGEEYKMWTKVNTELTPFKKDKEWIKKTLEAILNMDDQWKINDDRFYKQVQFELDVINHVNNNYAPDDSIFAASKKIIDYFTNLYKSYMEDAIYNRNTPDLSIKYDNIRSIIENAGYNFNTSHNLFDNNCTQYFLYNKYKTNDDGSKTGQGNSFIVKVNKNNNIVDIKLPLGDQLDIGYFTKSKEEKDLIDYNSLKSIYSHPFSYSKNIIRLIFGDKSQIVIDKLNELSKLDEKSLKVINTTEKKDDLSLWVYVMTIDNVEVTIGYDTGYGYISLIRVEHNELYGIIDDFFNDKQPIVALKKFLNDKNEQAIINKKEVAIGNDINNRSDDLSNDTKIDPDLLVNVLSDNRHIEWDATKENNDSQISIDINGDKKKEKVIIGRDHPNSTKVLVILGNTGYEILNQGKILEDAFDEFGDLNDGYFIQTSFFDFDKDGWKEIIIAVGNKLDELGVGIYKYDNGYELKYKQVGYIEGQKNIFINKDGSIDVMYGSQGLFDEYKYINGSIVKQNQ